MSRFHDQDNEPLQIIGVDGLSDRIPQGSLRQLQTAFGALSPRIVTDNFVLERPQPPEGYTETLEGEHSQARVDCLARCRRASGQAADWERPGRQDQRPTRNSSPRRSAMTYYAWLSEPALKFLEKADSSSAASKHKSTFPGTSVSPSKRQSTRLSVQI